MPIQQDLYEGQPRAWKTDHARGIAAQHRGFPAAQGEARRAGAVSADEVELDNEYRGDIGPIHGCGLASIVWLCAMALIVLVTEAQLGMLVCWAILAGFGSVRLSAVLIRAVLSDRERHE